MGAGGVTHQKEVIPMMRSLTVVLLVVFFAAAANTVPNTPPVAMCMESVNPSSYKIPPAGSTTLPGSQGGDNEDGFYALIGQDAEDGTAPVFVTNASGSATFGPFSSGSVVMITEAPGRTPTAKSIGGPNSAVAAHITLDSDAFVSNVLLLATVPAALAWRVRRG
jgi:hypothetical protein